MFMVCNFLKGSALAQQAPSQNEKPGANGQDISCHDVMEETVDLHLKWFAAQNGKSGTSIDKHGKKYDYDYGMEIHFIL